MKVSVILAAIAGLAVSACPTGPGGSGTSTGSGSADYELFAGWDGQGYLGDFSVTASDACIPFSVPVTVLGITVNSKTPTCEYVVFEQADCSDSGTIMGTGGLFSDAAGLKACKLTCS